MATPHIAAERGDFAKTVLMPGDPLRAKYVADHFLDNAVLVNNVRNVQGYTGEYKGKRVSVMASGMGMPSIGIYSYELFHFFDVDNIIRIGTAGAIQPEIRLRSVIAAMSAYSDSSYGDQYDFKGNFAPCCSFELLQKAVAAAEKLGIQMPVGPVFSSDVFYSAAAVKPSELLRRMGVMCVEMESYALYLNAAYAHKNALTLLTISDNVVTGEELDADQRQNSFTDMMKIALELA